MEPRTVMTIPSHFAARPFALKTTLATVCLSKVDANDGAAACDGGTLPMSIPINTTPVPSILFISGLLVARWPLY
jgi:hypothetical protein